MSLSEQKELIFEYGAEGGGTSLFRITNEDGTKSYFESGSYMQFDIDDNEEWKQLSGPVKNLNEFMDTFFSNENWYMFSPQFVHQELYSLVSLQLNKIDHEEIDSFRKRSFRYWEEIIKD